MQCVSTQRAWEVHAVRRELRVAEAARIGVHHLDAQLRWVGTRSVGVGVGPGERAWPALSLHILCTATTAAGQAGAGVSAGGACLSEDGGGPLVVDARHVGVHDGPLPCRQLAARDGAHLLGARVGVGVGVGVWARVGVGIRGRGSIGVRVGVRVGVGVWARARVKGRVKTRASRGGSAARLGR